MRTFKRLLCLFLVLSLLTTSGIAEVLATDYQADAQTVTYESDPLADLSEMFILEAPDDSEPVAEVESQNFTYTVLDAATCRIDGYTGELPQVLEIPEMLDSYAVVSIGEEAFSHSSVTTLVLPDSVTAIDKEAFRNCSALESVTFGAGLNSIGVSAFEGCGKLTSAELPDSVTSIGGGAFKNCVSLESFTYPASLTNAGSGISTGIFSGCSALVSVEIPEGITALPANLFRSAAALKYVTLPSTLQKIGSQAFENSGILSIDLPDTVTIIDSYAFQNCIALGSVNFGSGLTTIGTCAFDGCSALTSIILPNSVTSVGTGAFRDCAALETVILSDHITKLTTGTFSGCSALRSIHLPRSLQWIQRNVFKNCVDLTQLYIPFSVTAISEDAFEGIADLTFLCDLCSYAAEFAQDHQIPIVPTYVEEDARSTFLNPDTSYYIHNYDGLSASGVMSMVVHYELLEDAAISPSEITVNVYDYAALQENMITLDGKPCTDYDYDEETGRLTVPVENTSGTLRFCLKPLRYEALTSYARLQCTDRKGKTSVENIGAVNSLMPALNISARAETPSSAVQVSGLAVPETEISLYVDGSFVQTTRANKIGNYSTLVPLGQLEDGKEYIITAESFDRNGNPVQAQTGVTYRKSGVPELLDFTLTYNGNTYSLMNTHKARPYITFNTHGARPFRFEVTFPPTDNLEEVYVVSTRSGIQKYIEAVWDEDLGKYVAEGFFDPNNRNYIPGEITLEYVTEREKVCFDQTVDISSQEAYDALPDIWKDAQVAVLENTDTRTVLDVTVGTEEEQLSFELSISSYAIPAHITEQNIEALGFTKATDDYGNTLYYHSDKTDGNPSGQFSVVDFGKALIYDYIVDNAQNSLGNQFAIDPYLAILNIYKTLSDSAETLENIAYLKEMCANDPELTAEEKAEIDEMAMETMQLAVFSTTFKCAMTVAGVYMGIACPPAAPLFSLFSFASGKICDLFMELNLRNLEAKAYGTKFKINWAIDPSGYVYDTYTGKRLSGVTVRAYWVENTEDDPAFWDAPPAEDEYGVLWDSTEYSQRNPLLTDNDGRYAWDVPEGWWRVSYEKEGYESTWSEWLPVPPPQTEVNIGMKPLNAGLRGDLDNNSSVDDEDVIYLLWHTLMPLEYPVNQDVDFDRNNSIDDEDVIYLLWHTLMPLEYPLQ